MLIIIILAASVFYVYLNGLASPHPDQKKTVNLSFRDFENEIKSWVDSLEDNKDEIFATQKSIIKKQQKIVSENKEKIDENIEKALKRLEKDFEEKITQKEKELNKKS